MGLLDIIVIILIVSWLGGYSFHFGGKLIHALLVIAAVILVARLLGVRV